MPLAWQNTLFNKICNLFILVKYSVTSCAFLNDAEKDIEISTYFDLNPWKTESGNGSFVKPPAYACAQKM